MADMTLNGAPILIYARDEDTRKALQRTTVETGVAGATYQILAPEIAGYTVVKTDGETTGTFGDESRTVTFYYRHANWAETQDFDDQYVQVLKDTPVYDDIEGAPVSKIMAGARIKVSRRIATTDGGFWYELPDTRWVKYDNRNLQLEGEPLDTTIPEPEKAVLQGDEFKAVGIIDYIPNQEVTVYDQPFGHEQGKVADGLYVEIGAVLHHESGVDWYYLPDYGWLNSIYLRFPEHA
jgi:hypothetical protein